MTRRGRGGLGMGVFHVLGPGVTEHSWKVRVPVDKQGVPARRTTFVRHVHG